MKKLAISLSCLIAVATAVAQSVPGTWKVLPMQGTGITDIVETPGAVYYISASHPEFNYENSLIYFDKESSESGVMTPGQMISDGGVSMLKYNKEGKYLLCAYSNGNIDLLYDSGRMVNLPEIKESQITGSKAINDVFFKNGRIYVATDFGIVIYDEDNQVVKESGIFNLPVLHIGVMGDNLLLYGKLDTTNPNVYSLMKAPVEGRHNSLDRFSVYRSNVSVNDWIITGDNQYVTIGSSGNAASIVKVDIDKNGEFTFKGLAQVPGATKFGVCDKGYYCKYTNGIVILDEAGNVVSDNKIDSSYLGGQTALWNSSLKSVWCSNKNLVGNFDMSGSAVATLKDYYEVEGAKTYNNAYVVNSFDGAKAYVNGIGMSEYHPCGNQGWSIHLPNLLESYDWNTGELKHEYPEMSKQYSGTSQAEQNKFNIDVLFGGSGRTVIDPVDPTLIYHANNFEGLFLIRNREIVYRFHKGNSPIGSTWGDGRIFDLAFDNSGNLWVGMWRDNASTSTSTRGVYKVLLKESLELARTNPEALTEKDASGQYKYWQQPAWEESDHGKCDMHLAFSGNKGLKIDGSFNMKLIGIDTKGTSNVSDDSYVKYEGYLDQDGNVTFPSKQGTITVDKNGWFWIGSVQGVYIVKDIDQIGKNTSYLNAVRPKVAREDGTNYADYLLASEQIFWIDVDSNNNKWIATSNSGVYHVNEDGTKIIEILDKTNSPMRTNEVFTVISNPYGNDVLMGTRQGLYVYGSSSSPAAADYSDVKVYPNPVRPDYGGWVTIEGLMANSLVKIADASGNVVWTGRSEGGTCQWDVCDASGIRVHSGVYYVFASSNENGSSNGAVSKIVVIN